MKKSLSAIALLVSLAFAGVALAQQTGFEKPGFVTKMQDGRLWVFKEGAPELKKFEEHGELAVHVVRPAGGPKGLTLKAPDAETADAFMAAN